MIIIASKPGDFGTFATFTFTTLATRTFSVNNPISSYASLRIAANIVHYSGQHKILPCYLVISPCVGHGTVLLAVSAANSIQPVQILALPVVHDQDHAIRQVFWDGSTIPQIGHLLRVVS